MEVIYALIPMALALGLFFVFLFIWATKNGQYDDLDTPAHRMLLDDQPTNKNNQQPTKGLNDE